MHLSYQILGLHLNRLVAVQKRQVVIGMPQYHPEIPRITTTVVERTGTRRSIMNPRYINQRLRAGLPQPVLLDTGMPPWVANHPLRRIGPPRTQSNRFCDRYQHLGPRRVARICSRILLLEWVPRRGPPPRSTRNCRTTRQFGWTKS